MSSRTLLRTPTQSDFPVSALGVRAAPFKGAHQERQSGQTPNHLVLVAPANSTLALKISKDFALAEAIGDGKLAMADVMSVPAGKYGKAALEKLGGTVLGVHRAELERNPSSILGHLRVKAEVSLTRAMPPDKARHEIRRVQVLRRNIEWIQSWLPFAECHSGRKAGSPRDGLSNALHRRIALASVLSGATQAHLELTAARWPRLT
jgi:hypothetical protein